MRTRKEYSILYARELRLAVGGGAAPEDSNHLEDSDEAKSVQAGNPLDDL